MPFLWTITPLISLKISICRIMHFTKVTQSEVSHAVYFYYIQQVIQVLLCAQHICINCLPFLTGVLVEAFVFAVFFRFFMAPESSLSPPAPQSSSSEAVWRTIYTDFRLVETSVISIIGRWSKSELFNRMMSFTCVLTNKRQSNKHYWYARKSVWCAMIAYVNIRII